MVDIKTKKLKNGFSVGEYDNIEIYLDKYYFINCSKILRDTKSNKKISGWTRGKFAKALMKEIAKSLGVFATDLIVVYDNCHNDLRGSYCHPDLIPHLISWISPKFAHKVSKIVNEFMIREKLREKDEIIQNNVKELKNNSDQIKKLSEDVTELLVINKDQTKKITEQSKSMALLRKDARSSRKNTEYIIEELDKKCDHVVVNTGNKKDTNILIFYKNNDIPDPDNTDDDDEIFYDYTAARISRQSRNSQITQYQRSHPNADIILEIKYTPNAIVLWKYIIKYANKNERNILHTGRNFNLGENYSERKLIKDIKNAHNERFKYDEIDI